MLGNGDGTFQTSKTYSSGGLLSWMTTSGVNGDGKPDLVVANRDGGINGQGSVGVLLGKGDGTFGPVKPYSSGGLRADSIAAADVNSDGHPDLLVTNFWQCENCPGSVGVLLGNGDGSFQPAVAYSALSYVSRVKVVDLNKDGRLDLLLTDGGSYGGGMMVVLIGYGDGTFAAPVPYLTGGLYNSPPIVTDVNGDDKLDLLVAQDCSYVPQGCAAVLLGNGDGTFQATVTYPSGGPWARWLAAEDMNGDGRMDLLLLSSCGADCRDGGLVSLLLGRGDGTFQPPTFYNSGGGYSAWIGTSDVNGDGKPDVLAVNTYLNRANGSVGVLINTGIHTTATSLTSLPNPSLIGQNVRFTATVNSTSGTPPDGQPVTFKNGSSLLGTGTLIGGTGSFTIASLPIGVHAITATYGGDANFTASTSPELRQVVQSISKSATTTMLASGLNPSTYGHPVTLTAMVTSSGQNKPSGSVVFRASQNGTNFTVGRAPLNANGVASLTKSNLNGSYSYSITAVYSGDMFNLSSTSPVVTQVVKQTTSAATITSSANPSSEGQAVTFTARITSPTVTVTGPVTFTAGNTVLGRAQLSRGTATFTTSALPTGSITVKVTHPWNSNVGKSSASLVQTVSNNQKVGTQAAASALVMEQLGEAPPVRGKFPGRPPAGIMDAARRIYRCIASRSWDDECDEGRGVAVSAKQLTAWEFCSTIFKTSANFTLAEG